MFAKKGDIYLQTLAPITYLNHHFYASDIINGYDTSVAVMETKTYLEVKHLFGSHFQITIIECNQGKNSRK